MTEDLSRRRRAIRANTHTKERTERENFQSELSVLCLAQRLTVACRVRSYCSPNRSSCKLLRGCVSECIDAVSYTRSYKLGTHGLLPVLDMYVCGSARHSLRCTSEPV